MSGQRTFVTTRLVGRQLVDVNATHPKTDEARVSVRVGSTLLYARSGEILDHIADQWTRLQPQAHKLPRTANPRLVERYNGDGSTAVAVTFDNVPLCAAHLIGNGGHDPYFRIALGPLAYELRDMTSFATTMSGFMRARDMADRVFIDRFPTIGSEVGLEFERPFAAGG